MEINLICITNPVLQKENLASSSLESNNTETGQDEVWTTAYLPAKTKFFALDQSSGNKKILQGNRLLSWTGEAILGGHTGKSNGKYNSTELVD